MNYMEEFQEYCKLKKRLSDLLYNLYGQSFEFYKINKAEDLVSLKTNPYLYLWDICMEYYCESIKQGDEQVIQAGEGGKEKFGEFKKYMNENKEYSDSNPFDGFCRTVNTYKGIKGKNQYVSPISVEVMVSDDNIKFSSGYLMEFQIMLAQNPRVFNLFCKKIKGEPLANVRDLIWTAELLEQTEWSEYVYVYEKATGINLSLLVADYYKKFLEYLSFFETGKLIVNTAKCIEEVKNEVKITVGKKTDIHKERAKQELKITMLNLLRPELKRLPPMSRILLLLIGLEWSRLCIKDKVEYLGKTQFTNVDYVNRIIQAHIKQCINQIEDVLYVPREIWGHEERCKKNEIDICYEMYQTYKEGFRLSKDLLVWEESKLIGYECLDDFSSSVKIGEDVLHVDFWNEANFNSLIFVNKDTVTGEEIDEDAIEFLNKGLEIFAKNK